MKYTIHELANMKGVPPIVGETLISLSEQLSGEQEKICKLEMLAHNLGRELIRWREKLWPWTDQPSIVYSRYPLLKRVHAAMEGEE